MKTLVRVSFVLIVLAFFGAIANGFGTAEAKEVKKWRICSCCVPSDPMTIHAVNWAKAVERMTNGGIQITMFDSMKLGHERETLEQVQAHALEGGTFSNGCIPSFVPTQAIWSLPYLFKSREHAIAFDKTPEADILKAKFEEVGLKYVALNPQGFRSIMNSKRSIETPEDLKGMKIRTMENPIHMASFRSMGASVVPLNWGELYTALQTGVVDGFENSMSGFTETKAYEVCKYVSFTDHFVDAIFILMDLKVYNSLSPEEQKIIYRAADEVLDTQLKECEKMDREGLDLLKREGVTANYPDLEAFAKLVKPVYVDFEKDFPELKPVLRKIEALGKK